jgi:hypothetical protein
MLRSDPAVLPRLLLLDDDEDEEDEVEDEAADEDAAAEDRDEELERDTRDVAACMAEEPPLVELSADEATVPLELMLVPTFDVLVLAFDWTV